jgi:hypothetical protein
MLMKTAALGRVGCANPDNPAAIAFGITIAANNVNCRARNPFESTDRNQQLQNTL